MTAVPPPNAFFEGGCQSKVPFPFLDAGAFVEVDSVLSGGAASTSFTLSASTGGGLVQFTVTNGNLVFSDEDGFMMSQPYSATSMRWWRIRPVRSVPELVAEVSEDGTHWSTFVTEPVVPANNIIARITATVIDASDARPGMAVFRSFDVCPM